MPAEGKVTTVRNFRTFLPSFQGEDLLAKLEGKKWLLRCIGGGEVSFLAVLIGLLPWVLIIGFWIFMTRRTQQQMQGGPGGVFSFGASKARLFDVKKPG